MKKTSLYMHVPFCSRKCLFCSFVVSIGQMHRADDYVAALAQEIKAHSGKALKTVYLGGGTPSLLSQAQLESIMTAVRRCFILEDRTEISIEANPETITPTKAKFLKGLGFNRISLGVQSWDDRYLKFLGRSHDAATARRAFGFLREAGFGNINLDLMCAFPGQTAQELEADMRSTAALASEHLSVYTLTIEPSSRFYAQQMKLDDEEKVAEHYVLLCRLAQEHGFEQYEVSNFAKPGFESQHNLNYWLGEDYIGVGMGAHGFLDGRRYWNTSYLQDYLQHMRQQGPVMEGYEDLSEAARAAERLIFGLRMNKGIAWESVPPAKLSKIQDLIKDGFLQKHNGCLTATSAGRLVLDHIAVDLL